jgi:hypothetical protein
MKISQDGFEKEDSETTGKGRKKTKKIISGAFLTEMKGFCPVPLLVVLCTFLST